MDTKLPEEAKQKKLTEILANARKLSPLEMNKLAILKAHTVITFSSKSSSPSSSTEN